MIDMHRERGDLDKMTKKPISVQRELEEARRVISQVIIPPAEPTMPSPEPTRPGGYPANIDNPDEWAAFLARYLDNRVTNEVHNGIGLVALLIVDTIREAKLKPTLFPIADAPKDHPILAWCDHEADPYFIEAPKDGRSTLTLYGAHSEGMSHAPTGWHIVEWGGGFDDSTWEEPGAYLPDWWFVAGSEFEVAANPTHWTDLPEKPHA